MTIARDIKCGLSYEVASHFHKINYQNSRILFCVKMISATVHAIWNILRNWSNKHVHLSNIHVKIREKITTTYELL